MTSEELVRTLRIAAQTHEGNIPLHMLLIMAAEHITALNTASTPDETSEHGSYCSCRDCRETAEQARFEAGHTVSNTEPPPNSAPLGPSRV